MRVVITSVDYADFLAVTLPAWQAFLPQAVFTVATSPDDDETQAVASQAGARVHVTTAWTDGGAKFNKARGLDEAFGFTSDPPLSGEWCLALDADVYPFGAMPSTSTLAPDTLYGCPRYQCATATALEAHRSGRLTRDVLSLMSGTCRDDGYVPARNTLEHARLMASKCLGYFQLFAYRPGISFGDFPDNAPADKAFRQHFRRLCGLVDVYVLHLGEASRSNWLGRVVPSWGVVHG